MGCIVHKNVHGNTTQLCCVRRLYSRLHLLAICSLTGSGFGVVRSLSVSFALPSVSPCSFVRSLRSCRRWCRCRSLVGVAVVMVSPCRSLRKRKRSLARVARCRRCSLVAVFCRRWCARCSPFVVCSFVLVRCVAVSLGVARPLPCRRFYCGVVRPFAVAFAVSFVAVARSCSSVLRAVARSFAHSLPLRFPSLTMSNINNFFNYVHYI